MGRAIDWIEALRRLGVRYVDRGPNVKQGEINIQCPFCGSADRSHHMGLNLSNGYWACWRSSSHRGKRPHRLLRRLGASDSLIQELCGGEVAPTPVSTLRKSLASKDVASSPISCDVSEYYLRRIKKGDAFYKYLRQRGFTSAGVRRMTRVCRTRCSMRGDLAYRIVFPIVWDNKVVGVTGRAIGDSIAKYKSYPRGELGSYAPVKRYLLFGDRAEEGQTLVVCEGPMDAAKLIAYAPERCHALAIMGVTMTNAQVAMLARLGDLYTRVVLQLDSSATSQSLSLLRTLPFRVSRGVLPRSVVDPGDLSEKAAVKYWAKHT